ncbi:MAG: hypothetical protein DME10_10830 [Candidatus Rokuibacteriota bacterium]|nr:MAG: hypothetical protein DME10_10830 [Candidatus Rokubacteria bacterium]
MAAAAAGAALSPRILGAQGAPWAQRPPGNPQKLTFVVWQYGKIYEQIAKQFEDDWGIKLNQIIEPNVEPQVAKLTTMFGAGDEVDVSLSPIQYLASYIQQGIAVPIDGLPGVDQYVKDFTPFARAAAQRDGKTWGLPYFSTAWIFIYNDELLGKAGFKGKPFKSYPELVEQARKAKRDGVAKYPILWIAGAGFEQLPGTWFNLTWNRGGVIFDKQLAPQLGPGSVARETLKWWQSTFKEELADPNSLNLRFIPACKAFNAGQHVFLGTLHHYYISLINDQAQSPIAGKGRVLGLPGDGKTIGYTMQAQRLAQDAMLASGYQSVMESDLLRKAWAKWADVPTVLDVFKKATNFADVVPAVSQPWYPRWSDAINVELTACLQGKSSADQACDNMIAALATAKRG